MRFLKILLNSIIEARQTSANYEVARTLQRTEYPNEPIERILRCVEKRDFEQLK